MKRLLLACTFAIPLALGLSVTGVTVAGPAGATHAYASGGQGLAQFCKDFVASGVFPLFQTEGACVGTIASNGQANSFAPGFCDFLASYTSGYPTLVPYYDQNGNFQIGFAKNKGQCVAIYAQNGFPLI